MARYKKHRKPDDSARGFVDNTPLSVAAPDISPDYDPRSQPRAVWDMLEGEVIEVLCGKIYPLPEQKYYAKELCYMLNNNYHHDGRWQVTWTEPVERKYHNGIFRPHVPEKLVFTFFNGPLHDPATKLCFDYIIDESFIDILQHDPKDWMEGASGAVDYFLKHNVEDAINGDEYLIKEAKESAVPGSTELQQIEGARV